MLSLTLKCNGDLERGKCIQQGMQWFFSLMGFHFICCLKACRVKWWDDGLLQMFGWRQWIVWTGARSQVRSANQEIASSSSPSYCTLGNQADKLVFFFSRTSGPYAPIFSNVSLHPIVTLYKLCQEKMMIEQSIRESNILLISVHTKQPKSIIYKHI